MILNNSCSYHCSHHINVFAGAIEELENIYLQQKNCAKTVIVTPN